jgi:hypothetical protein
MPTVKTPEESSKCSHAIGKSIMLKVSLKIKDAIKSTA